MRVAIVLVFLSSMILNASPSGDWHLDELGDNSYNYYLNDEVIANDDGIAYSTNSTGNSGGKVCSALDFTPSSTANYATLDEDSINGANDVTISVWLKTTSHNGRALLSGARTGQDNAIIDDNVSANYDASSIANLKIDSGNACNCLNPTAAGANGSDGGVNGDKVKLDYDDVASGATECGYFEVRLK